MTFKHSGDLPEAFLASMRCATEGIGALAFLADNILEALMEETTYPFESLPDLIEELFSEWPYQHTGSGLDELEDGEARQQIRAMAHLV